MAFGALPDLNGKRIVLTGATGFVGNRVLEACVAAGADVSALVRSGRGADAVRTAGADPVEVALTDRAGVSAALAGADAVLHLAYDVRTGSSENLAVFDALLAAAEEAQVGRFIHASSVVVYDDWPNADLDETHPRSGPGGGFYRQAKIAMESRLASSFLPSVVLQPTLVYGPKSGLWTNQLADALRRGGVVLPDPDGLCNPVFVDDVAQAFVRAVVLENPESETFLISGPKAVTWSAFFEGYKNIIGGSVIREPANAIAERLGPEPEVSEAVPLAAKISAVGRRMIGGDRFERLVGLAKSIKPSGPQGPMAPDHHMFKLYTATGRCRIDHARSQLGYDPTYDLAAGMAATAPYLKTRFGAST